MSMKINSISVANFDIHDKSNLAQGLKKWKQSFEFSLSASGTDDHWQMRALLFYWAGADIEDICMHLEDAGATYKAAMDALNQHF